MKVLTVLQLTQVTLIYNVVIRVWLLLIRKHYYKRIWRFSMSVLELNGRVFDASTTGTLTLTGEGGAATTDVTQGLAKAWLH